jgi:UDP-N-acetylglucosamine:LPS N-acetylglucosamine transferase
MFAKNDAAIVIEEKDLNPEMFSNLLLHLMKDRGRRQSLGKAAFALALPKAADSLASEVLNLARKRHA